MSPRLLRLAAFRKTEASLWVADPLRRVLLLVAIEERRRATQTFLCVTALDLMNASQQWRPAA